LFPNIPVTASITEVVFTNNAVLIYDSLNQAWSGYDQQTGIYIRDWVTVKYNGTNRLFFLSWDGFLNLYEDLFEDELATPAGVVTRVAIAADWTSRGYLAGTRRPKYFDHAEAALSTWYPNYSVEAIFDGVRETKALVTTQTRSRVNYYKPHTAAAWDPDNSNDDFFTPFREDYSVILSGLEEIFTGNNGFDPDLHQEVVQRVDLEGEGKWMQLRFNIAQGRLEVRSIELDARDGERRAGVLV